MEQKLLFEEGASPADYVLGSIAEVREFAGEYLSTPEAESPLRRAQREQAARANGAHLRGMVAKWADYEIAKGHISMHDPGSGEWHDITYRDAQSWARWEARKRTELYRGGDRRAYELTSRQMEQIWEQDHAEPTDLIVEDHPIEEEA